MTETEFFTLAQATLDRIEAAMDRLNDEDLVDVECRRSGNVLEIEFLDSGLKMVVNSQAPTQQMWLAAKTGGYHYQRAGEAWIDTRDGSELFAVLARLVGEQAGQPVSL
ncbi:iron donor protein CyaY [Massilia sp. TS11]|uniref:iron donor protein CyaY n=1 Tax=Massilia sp. TS11 TaxID=2908003 RepID=UPI001EDAFDF6|nr:iron donor protein CyaY [Massilia sp. TS11]MCG2584906.1 iron donor protein CyaY [Massilia sp. TS11]